MEEASALASGWACLPSDLLDSILEKLIPVSDYIMFSAVCKHWRSIALHNRKKRLESCHRQLPMLMVPSKDNNDEMRGLYSVTQGKTYTFELHVPYNRRCCGSSHRLLAYADDKSVITLLNPFTGCAIRLPPVTKVPQLFIRPERYIRKVVLSADPYLFPNDYEALVIYDHSKIAHLKLRDVSTKKQKKKSGKKKKSGDDGWTHIATDTRSQFSDVIYYKGQFLVVSHDGPVFSINVNSETTEPYINKVVEQAPLFGLGPYLVESSRGELLLIMRFEGFDFHLRMTVSFKVFKLLCACGDRPELVEEIESIGSDALFLGEVESMCVSALDFPGCQPNCIYFSTSDWGCHIRLEAEGPLDMAAFNLAPRRMETHYFSSSRLTKMMPSSVWILPTVVLKP